MKIRVAGEAKIFLNLAAVTALGLGIVFLAVLPLARRNEDIQGQIAENTGHLAQVAAEIENQQRLAEQLALVGDDKDRILQMFPVREEMVQVVQGIEQAAKNSGVGWTLSFEDEIEDPDKKSDEEAPVLPAGAANLSIIQYTVYVTGDYRQVSNFFDYLNNSFFITNVNKFTLSAEALQEGEDQPPRNTGFGTVKARGLLFVTAK